MYPITELSLQIQLFPLTVGNNVNLNKLHAVLIVCKKKILFFHIFHIFHIFSQFSSVFSKSFHYSTCLSSIFYISFHISTCLSSISSISFHNSTWISSAFFISFHYSTWLSSIFSISFHYSTWLSSIFSSPDPNCHHLASVVVVRRKLFQKSSPLKVLDQWKPNLV
jgi:hypothetical protein